MYSISIVNDVLCNCFQNRQISLGRNPSLAIIYGNGGLFDAPDHIKMGSNAIQIVIKWSGATVEGLSM